MVDTKVNKNKIKFSKKALKLAVDAFKPVPIAQSYVQKRVIVGVLKKVKLQDNKIIGAIEMYDCLDLEKYFIGYKIYYPKENVVHNKKYKTIYHATIIGAAICEKTHKV